MMKMMMTTTMTTEMVLETSVHYRHLTRLIAREDFIEFSRRESSRTNVSTRIRSLYTGLAKNGCCKAPGKVAF
jgi:hypothetical protein